MHKRLSRLILASALLLGVVVPAAPALAAATSISLTANRSTVTNGGSLIVAVYINGGGNPINAIEVDLNYPASKLQYVGYSSSGSAFEIAASNGGGDGAVTIARGTTGSITGSALVGTVTFRGLVSSGSAAIGISGSSSLVSSGNAVAYGAYGVSVNFGVPAPTPAAAPAAPAPPKDTTPPVISNVKLSAVTPFSATVNWTTNEPSDSAVDYGLDATYGLSASSATLTTTHSVALSSAFLTPETVLHYRVKSTDGSGNVATGSDLSFQLPGVPVTVIVLGPDGKPQVGASVTLDNQTGTTDSKGSVTLPASLGNKKITTTYQGVTVQKPITVTKTAKPLPPYKLDLSRQPLNHWMLSSIGLIVLVLVLLGVDAMLFGSRIFTRLTGLYRLFPAHATATTAKSKLTTLEPESKADQAAKHQELVDELEVTDNDEPVDATKTIAELMELSPEPADSKPPIVTAKSTPIGGSFSTEVPELKPVLAEPAVKKIVISDTIKATPVKSKPVAKKAPAKTKKSPKKKA